MDTTFWNRLMLVILGICLFLWVLNNMADWIFSQPDPVREGYYLPALQRDNQYNTVNSGRQSISKNPPIGNVNGKDSAELIALLAKADPQRGQMLFQQCAICHSAQKNGAIRIGPPLWDVAGRPVASVKNFRYSNAMHAMGSKGYRWTDQNLFEFLKSPRQYVKGTLMAFMGISWDQDRAHLIAYLHQLSDNPKLLHSLK